MGGKPSILPSGLYEQLITEGICPRGNLSWHHYWFSVTGS